MFLTLFLICVGLLVVGIVGTIISMGISMETEEMVVIPFISFIVMVQIGLIGGIVMIILKLFKYIN